MDERTMSSLTLTFVVPVTPFSVADAVALPVPVSVARPELLIVSADGFDELQVT
jgi:hypothetical protein